MMQLSTKTKITDQIKNNILIQKYLRFCPRSGKFVGFKTPHNGFLKIFTPFIGLAALLWVVFRVGTKPSRITYPCVQASIPVASSFIGYVLFLTVGLAAWLKMRNKSQVAVGFISVFAVVGVFGTFSIDSQTADNIQFATFSRTANQPMGTAVGIFPGRVVWVHNPDATNENCDPMKEGDSYYEPKNSNQDVIDQMLSQAIQSLTGKTSDSSAWVAIFKFHNNTMGKGEIGYKAGEKVFLKMNATSGWSGNYNDADLSKVYKTFGTVNRYYGLSETSPTFILSVLRQLVYKANVAQEDIYLGDPMKFIYKHMYQYLHTEFPNVHYLDHTGHTSLGRELAVKGTDTLIRYSDRGTVLVNGGSGGGKVYGDRLYKIHQDMEYMLSLPAMKGHVRGGVTMFAKNHFGSQSRDGANHLHNGLMKPGETGLVARPGYGLYRVQVDIMGSKILGKKNLIYLMDALWSTDHELNPPTKFKSAPFNNDWTSSIFASLDPVGIESVGYDFIRSEFTKERYPTSYENVVDVIQLDGVCDYLEQAADSANWPKGIKYNPENDGTIIGSLGVHEHWNNSIDKQYSRNLGTGNGIELIKLGKVTSVQHSPVAMDFKLNQNYPNPFNPATTISFSLNKSAQVKLSIYDALGRLVKVLIDGQLSEGQHNIEWNSKDYLGTSVSSGVYVYKIIIKAEDKLIVQSKKMILVK